MGHNKQENWPTNIPITLFEAWKKHRQYGDGLKMCKELGYSRPTIDKAINYGHVRSPELVDLITEWFLDRVNKRKDQVEALYESIPTNKNKK